MVLSTEWSQVELIELINEGNGLGFMLVGGRSTGVVIKAVIPGGAAERDGRMQAGDHVLQINEVALRGFSSDQVAQVLRQTGQQVRLIVARSVEPTSADFHAIPSHAPIIPTKLLADPDELDRILQQTSGYGTTAAGATGGATATMDEIQPPPPPPPAVVLSNISLTIPPHSLAVPALVSTTISEPTVFRSSNNSHSLTETASSTAAMVTVLSAGTIAARDGMEVINRTNNNTVSSTTSPPSSLPVVGGGVANGVAKRPCDIPLPLVLPSTEVVGVQCDGIDSTTTCSSDEGGLDLDTPETEVYQVELHKNVYGLGITVAGYVCEEEDLSGIFVKSIIEGSAAEISGIQINDRIVEVNGRSLNGVTNHQAVDILRQTDITVVLRLERFLRGRRFEHLQTALTEIRGVGSSTPSTPMGSRSSMMVRSQRQSMGSNKSMDLIIEEKRSSEDSLEESKITNKKSKKQEGDEVEEIRRQYNDGEEEEEEEEEQVVAVEDIHSCRSRRSIGSNKSLSLGVTPVAGPPLQDNASTAVARRNSSRLSDDRSTPLVVSEEIPLGGGGMVIIENEMESHTTIDSNVYNNDYGLNGDEEDDNELVMIENHHQRCHSTSQRGSLSYPQHEQIPLQPLHVDPLVRQWQSELSSDSKVIAVELNKLSGLGISLEGTVEVEGGIELHPHHFIRSILEEGPVGKNGVLRPGDELLQVNEHRLQGRKHIEVVQIIKELPRQVKIICARGRKPPSVINTSQSPEAFEARSILGPGGLKSLQNLLTTKAQSESSLYTSSTATLTDQQRSKSFEQVSGLALWTNDVVYVDVEKTDAGFGFSILDYQDPLDPDGTVIVIRGLIPGGAAEATNLIFPGDRLVYVNSVNLHGMTLDQAVAVLKCVAVGSRVRMGLCRPLSTSDSNIDESPRSAAETPTT